MNLNRRLALALDRTATGLARRQMRRSRPTPNTLEELHPYTAMGVDKLFGVEPPIPDMRLSDRRKPFGFRWTDITFESPHEPLSESFGRLQKSAYQANNVVHARWIRHRRGGARPTMLFLHSWMQPVSWFEDVMLLPRFASALNVDVLSMHLPYHGQRKPEASAYHGEYFWTADLVRTFEALRQSVHDARALIGWLARETDAPIGVMGVSLGGMVALALSCFESRLDFSIPVAAHLDLAGILEDAALLTPMRRELERHGWQPEDVYAYTHSLGLYDVSPCIPRERILFIAGLYDRILTAERTEALWERWGKPHIHWFPGGHLGILLHMRKTLAAARRHIERTTASGSAAQSEPQTQQASSSGNRSRL